MKRQLEAGWRAFQCDECGAQWQSASRDHASPSGEDCEKCGAWVFPHLHRPDPTLQCDEFGNLLRAYERRHAFTRSEALVALAIVATLVGLLVPVFQAASAAGKRQQDIRDGKIPAGDPVASAQPTWSLRTVRHDNHLWVMSTGNADCFVHHPDCPCQKPAEKP